VFHPQAANKGLHFELTLAPDLPRTVCSDDDHLRPILRNLVANAVKFTLEGSVGLHVRRAAAGWSSTHPTLSAADTVLAFEVTDTGIGIAAEKLPLIFDAFEQVDANSTRRFGGTGLGLHIARTNAELLGGELAAESTAGRGSVFTLFLPLRYAGPANLRAQPADDRPIDGKKTPGPLAGCKVLIAEPDLRSRISITAALEQYGLQPMAAAGGEEALKLLASAPDIKAVIMDIGLLGMSGHAVLGAIRQRCQSEDLPVIALTTGSLPGDHTQGLTAGCTEYLTKPVLAPQLLDALQACVKKQ
jgi:CheY-like chemotaxis protein